MSQESGSPKCLLKIRGNTRLSPEMAQATAHPGAGLGDTRSTNEPPFIRAQNPSDVLKQGVLEQEKAGFRDS